MIRIRSAACASALLLVLPAPLLLQGCAGTPAGSTWEKSGTPAPTLADESMKPRILTSIAQAEGTCGADAAPQLVETRRVTQTDAKVEEAWVVSRGAGRVAYLVTLIRGDQAGSPADFFVSGRCN